MIELIAAMLASASRSEIPPETWNCRNQIEVWCAADGCAATRADEFTPMDIWASLDGRVSACAYTGCWEGEAAVVVSSGRILWAGDDLEFVSGGGGSTSDVTLLITAEDGVGFIRAAGFATPLLCARSIRHDESE